MKTFEKKESQPFKKRLEVGRILVVAANAQAEVVWRPILKEYSEKAERYNASRVPFSNYFAKRNAEKAAEYQELIYAQGALARRVNYQNLEGLYTDSTDSGNYTFEVSPDSKFIGQMALLEEQLRPICVSMIDETRPRDDRSKPFHVPLLLQITDV